MPSDNNVVNKKNNNYELRTKTPFTYGGVETISIGYFNCDDHYIEEVAEHQGYDVCYACYGSGYIEYEGKIERLRQGYIFMSMPGKAYKIKGDNEENSKIYYIKFKPLENDSEKANNQILNKCSFSESKIIRDRYRIDGIFIRIFHDLLTAEIHKEVMLELLLTNLILIIVRNFNVNSEARINFTIIEQSEVLVHKIVNIIEERMTSPLNLENIALELNYSISHISRIFSKFMNMSIMQYYNYVRLNKSKALLDDNNSITWVAKKLCYSDIKVFNKAFKEMFGISPSQYILSNKNGLAL